jgi:hypothetical protein
VTGIPAKTAREETESATMRRKLEEKCKKQKNILKQALC